ncbi:MAG: glycosyltransferase family 2 protein [Patescibacteria group bacterium]
MSPSQSLSHKITVLIPCYNEEAGIASVIRSFPRVQLLHHGFELEILVIDNDSCDATAEIALREGAKVVHEPQRGKGNAIRLGFSHISLDTDYVVMLDGDATYRPDEILRLVELLHSRFATVAIGSRLGGRIQVGAMHGVNRIGNWIFSHLIRQLYHVNVTDVLTGYFAWRREAVDRLRPHLTSNGFAIEMEMVTKMARLGEEIYCVPISYYPRRGNSSLRPVQDGVRILWMLMRNLLWNPEGATRPTWQPRPVRGYASNDARPQANPVVMSARLPAGVES